MRSAGFLPVVLATVAQSFIVPQDLPNGAYSITFNYSTGAATGEFIPLLSLDHAKRSGPDAALHARQGSAPPPANNWPTCYEGSLDLEDFEIAMAEFKGICEADTSYVPETAVVVKHDDAMAYMCNFNAFYNRCLPSDYEEASSVLDDSCGEGVPGDAYVPFWHKTYGRARTGDDICI